MTRACGYFLNLKYYLTVVTLNHFRGVSIYLKISQFVQLINGPWDILMYHNAIRMFDSGFCKLHPIGHMAKRVY